MSEPTKDDLAALVALIEKNKMSAVRHYVPEYRDGEWAFVADPVDAMFDEAILAVFGDAGTSATTASEPQAPSRTK
jgi:hypothetical protein